MLSSSLASKYGLSEEDGLSYGAVADVVLPARRKRPRAEILAARAAAAAAAAAEPRTRVEKRASKSATKRLAALAADRAARARRGENYASLAETSLSREQQLLLRASGALGASQSVRESLADALRRERAGLTPRADDGRDALLVATSEGKKRARFEANAKQAVGGPLLARDSGREKGPIRRCDNEDSGSSGGDDDSDGEGGGADLADAVGNSDDDSDVDIDDKVDDDGEEGEEGEEGDDDNDEYDDDGGDDDDDDDEDDDDDDGDDDDSEDYDDVEPDVPKAFSINLSLLRKPASAALVNTVGAAAPALNSSSDDLMSTALSSGGKFAQGRAEAAAVAGGLVAAGTKIDESTRKLLELRERNKRDRADGRDAVDYLGAREETATTEAKEEAAAAASRAAETVGRTAYVSTDAWDVDEGPGALRRQARRAAAEADAAASTNPRDALWTADGRSRVPAAAAPLATSSLSAYAPIFTPLTRPLAATTARESLPVVQLEQEIMEAISQHDVVVIAGETGSGKTTQVPQFLLEAGYGLPRSAVRVLPRDETGEGGAHARAAAAVAGAAATLGADAVRASSPRFNPYRPHAAYAGVPGLIGVTQPRRVAATSMARRIASELGTSLGRPDCTIGYQVRFDRATVRRGLTRVKFLTEGVLLREMAADVLLRAYSVIVLDEAHERGINTDVLLGLLSRTLPLRNKLSAEAAASLVGSTPLSPTSPDAPLAPLKLIIMSATLRATDITENKALFPRGPPPPIVTVKARQHAVTAHFSKKTELVDYVRATEEKVRRIHDRLPDGGILVFLTGQNEVEDLCARLTRALGRTRRGGVRAAAEAETAATVEAAASAARVMQGTNTTTSAVGAGDAAGAASESAAATPAEPAPKPLKPALVLPLFAMLPRAQQDRVFAPPPDGTRLIVVATNVAETSITIPGIRYVVDAGRTKRRIFDPRSGVSRFEVGWISQASAAQRAGRAGRTGPGHAYRLYSSAVFSRFPAFDEPEVTRTPTPTLVLALKGVGVSSVASFPFPSPPPPGALLSGIRSLVSLGALETHLRPGAGGGGAAPSLGAIESEELTPLGEALARLPVAPPLGKILVLAAQAQKAALASAADGDGDDDGAFARSRLADYASHLVAVMATDNLLVLPSLPRTATESTDRQKSDGADSEESDDEGARGDALLAAVEEEVVAAEALLTSGQGGTSKVNAAADAADAAAAAAAAAALASARAAHARLRHPLSDALTRLRALGAYAFTARGAPRTRLCKEWALRAKGMSEALALAGQLRDAVRVVIGDVKVHAVGAEDGGGRWSMSVDAGEDACVDGASVTASEGEGGGGGGGGGTAILDGAKAAAERVLAGGSLDAAEASAVGVDTESTSSLILPPPSAVTETLLRQVLLGGLIGHVARRARPDEASAACAAAGIPPGRGVPYVPASASLRDGISAGIAAARAANAERDATAGGDGDAAAAASTSAQNVVWIHPQSSVSDADAALAPAYIVFENVRFGKSARAWAVGVTAVEESWISSLARGTPLLVLGKHVPTPAPSYAPATDSVLATFTPVFGDAQWRLPPIRTTLEGEDARACDARVRAFARALLEGTAVPALAPIVSAANALRSPASSLSRSDVPAPIARAGNLLRALSAPDKVIPPRAAALLGDDAHSATVDSARSLARVWQIAPGFLCDEIAAWCREEAVAELKRAWPAAVRAFLIPFVGGPKRADVVIVEARGRAERHKA